MKGFNIQDWVAIGISLLALMVTIWQIWLSRNQNKIDNLIKLNEQISVINAQYVSAHKEHKYKMAQVMLNAYETGSLMYYSNAYNKKAYKELFKDAYEGLLRHSDYTSMHLENKSEYVYIHKIFDEWGITVAE